MKPLPALLALIVFLAMKAVIVDSLLSATGLSLEAAEWMTNDAVIALLEPLAVAVPPWCLVRKAGIGCRAMTASEAAPGMCVSAGQPAATTYSTKKALLSPLVEIMTKCW